MDMFIVLLTQDQVGVQNKIPNKTRMVSAVAKTFMLVNTLEGEE